jgi:hypothetical protein
MAYQDVRTEKNGRPIVLFVHVVDAGIRRRRENNTLYITMVIFFDPIG